MLSQQLKRIQELSDTLVALNDKFECVNRVNTRLELQIEAQDRRCQDYAVESIKQLAVIETLSEDLQRARAREEQLSEIIKGLQEAIETRQNTGGESHGHRANTS